MLYKKQLSKEQALQKLRHYCGYQERCANEVEEKLYSLAIPAKDHAEIISTLIEENCLDEERFAMAYAGGKFRVKGWGRIKIKHALRQKKINEYTISRALDQIDKGEYELTLKKLAEEKYVFLKNDQYLIRKKKTIDYLMQKGYEPKLISTIVNALSQKKR
jgi:regulatory protein